jgi:hypothetical protein
MGKIFHRPGAIIALAAVTVIGAVALAQQSLVPRSPAGIPDLNGIWQALNEANYDLEAHVAHPAMALRPGPYGPLAAVPVLALGAVGAVPPSLGVVEGGEIPYRREALARRKQNQGDWLNLDPEIKCYLPGVPRANYMPYPFQILRAPMRSPSCTSTRARENIYLKDPTSAGDCGWPIGWTLERRTWSST